MVRELFIYDRYQILIEQTMDDAVAHRGDGNISSLAVAHGKMFILSMGVGTCHKVVMETQ